MTDETNENGVTALDTPAQINAWVFLSRMHQLALELNCPGMKAARVPILAAMYRAGMIDVNLRGTRANKLAVLGAMVDTYRENVPGWEPSPSIARALSS
jgi:hypothetical protein